MTNQPSPRSTSTRTGARIHPVGPPPTKIRRTARALPPIALAACALWIVIAWIIPLPSPRQAQPVPIEPVVAPAANQIESSRRTAIVDRLSRRNRFSADGASWIASRPEPALANAAEPARVPPATPLAATTPGVHAQQSDASASIHRHLDAIELRGVFIHPEADPVALIGFVHAQDRLVTTPVRRGETFGAPNDPGKPWRVRGIDVDQRRVTLEREGRTATLAMFELESDRADALPAESLPAVPAIAITSREQIVDELQNAGIDQATIAQLFLAMNDQRRSEPLGPRSPTSAGASPVTPAISARPDAPAPASPPPMPAALDRFLEQMSRQRPANESGARTRAPPHPLPAGREGG